MAGSPAPGSPSAAWRRFPRAAACEAALQGARLEAASFERAAAALANDFTRSATSARAEYRLLTAQNLLRKCFLELHAPAVETRVTAYV